MAHIIKNDLRPCYITANSGDEVKALFHCWATYSNVIPPSVLKGGHTGRVVSRTVAIVEIDDGRVLEIHPTNIRFGTGEFEKYCFEEV